MANYNVDMSIAMRCVCVSVCTDESVVDRIDSGVMLRMSMAEEDQVFRKDVMGRRPMRV